jgi:hypothetical protein
MTTQKIIVCYAKDAEQRVQPLLTAGWVVVHCVAEVVSSTDRKEMPTWGQSNELVAPGQFVFILEPIRKQVS